PSCFTHSSSFNGLTYSPVLLCDSFGTREAICATTVYTTTIRRKTVGASSANDHRMPKLRRNPNANFGTLIVGRESPTIVRQLLASSVLSTWQPPVSSVDALWRHTA